MTKPAMQKRIPQSVPQNELRLLPGKTCARKDVEPQARQDMDVPALLVRPVTALDKDRKPMVCKHSRLARKCEICDLEERCENAERIILLLTADHNTGETYQKGFEAAREHFADYPHKAAL